jgi:hypothetical protein
VGLVAAVACTRAVGAQAPATQAPTGQAPAAPPSASTAAHGGLHGVVYDSLARGPLAGAAVQVARFDDPAVTALANRRFGWRVPHRLAAAGPLPHRFLHPTLDLLELEVRPRVVDVAAGGAGRVDLGIPGLAQVRPALCGAAAPAGDSSGVLAGRVRNAETGLPAEQATVVLTWSEITIGAGGIRTERRRVPVATGAAGAYVVCGAPAGSGVVASASAPGLASGLIDLDVPARGMLVRDFLLGDTTTVAAEAPPAGAGTGGRAQPDSTAPRVARGTARVAGIVRDPGGRPLRGARSFVWGAAANATTGEAGTFALDGLPAGTRTLEVRAVGYEPRRVVVDLVGGRAAAVDVRMARVVPTLDRVVVMGKASPRDRRLHEFLDRRQRNPFGRFITGADLERMNPLLLSDALRTTPGLRVVPTGNFGNVVLGRGNCLPAVFLDGMPVQDGARELDQLVPPQQVGGIEVYNTIGGIPAQYSGLAANGCGVVLIWTRR